MNLFKSKLPYYAIFILALGYFLILKFNNKLEKTSTNNYPEITFTNESIPINIFINKEKDIRIGNELLNQNKLKSKSRSILNSYTRGKDIREIVFHLYVEESISNGYITDILDEFYSKIDREIQIKRKMHFYKAKV